MMIDPRSMPAEVKINRFTIRKPGDHPCVSRALKTSNITPWNIHRIPFSSVSKRNPFFFLDFRILIGLYGFIFLGSLLKLSRYPQATGYSNIARVPRTS